MAAKICRIKIVTNGNELEAEGDKAFVLDMLKRFGSQPSNISQTAPKSSGGKGASKKEAHITQPPSVGKDISIREFIQQFEIKKQTDITVAFGYYLEKHAGASEFSPADINKCYYDAKMESSNTSQMIILNIRRGFMMEVKKSKDSKGTKRYTLTSSGEKFVENTLPRSS